MPPIPHPRNAWILGLLAAGAAMALAILPVITQDAAYHRFADTRPVLGVAHGWNVLSNAPFLAVGLLGLWRCRQTNGPSHAGGPALPEAAAGRLAWQVAFSGITLVALGSAWYHHAPTDDALVWDRLPMTIGFMGLLAAVLEPQIGARAGRALLGPAVLAGAASVGWWHWTGDLRPYLWVQLAPLLLIAAVIALDPRRPATRPLLAALLLYGGAKGLETADATVLAVTGGLVAGHALKHLAAAAACLALVRVAERSGRAQESASPSGSTAEESRPGRHDDRHCAAGRGQRR